MSVRNEIINLRNRMAQEIIGQEEILERILVAVLSNGNLLVEGLPGLAKTRAIKALANNIDGSYGRIQFTPDLASSDITGKEVVHHEDGQARPTFKFMPGPIFNNIVLADEINRAPSKTQNALLEAMEERQVTVAAQAYKMPKLFMVMATMNPSTQQGVFPLPEAQKDRFLMHVTVDYPDEDAEANIIKLVRGEQNQVQAEKEALPPVSQDTIFAARGEIDHVQVPEHVLKYMVDFIFMTRYPERINYELKSYISVGASPRGSLGLDKAVRSYAWLKGDAVVDIGHVQAMVKAILRHRIMLTERALKNKVTTDELIDDILEKLVVPKVA
ncbi:MAG: MoxR family ATPase [Rhodospirillales bacterium]|nr:MoxR family ATPase [Rhodospirillales bacterium]MCB9964603.1 MoxR family ATPase [Rhodospirillales bacterium]